MTLYEFSRALLSCTAGVLGLYSWLLDKAGFFCHFPTRLRTPGRMAEWTKAVVLKTTVVLQPPGVRIPLLPPKCRKQFCVGRSHSLV